MNLLPASAEALLRAKERTGIGGPDVYCSDVTTEEARALEEAFNDAGLKQGENVWRLEYHSPPGPSGVHIYFEPYLPHGKVTCSPCG